MKCVGFHVDPDHLIIPQTCYDSVLIPVLLLAFENEKQIKSKGEMESVLELCKKEKVHVVLPKHCRFAFSSNEAMHFLM